MRRLFALCQIHNAFGNMRKFCIYKRGFPSRYIFLHSSSSLTSLVEIPVVVGHNFQTNSITRLGIKILFKQKLSNKFQILSWYAPSLSLCPLETECVSFPQCRRFKESADLLVQYLSSSRSHSRTCWANKRLLIWNTAFIKCLITKFAYKKHNFTFYLPGNSLSFTVTNGKL